MSPSELYLDKPNSNASVTHNQIYTRIPVRPGSTTGPTGNHRPFSRDIFVHSQVRRGKKVQFFLFLVSQVPTVVNDAIFRWFMSDKL